MRFCLAKKLFSSAVALGVLSFSVTSSASNAFEVPDHGVEQFGRGGAWVARASDPMAAWFNPAALATQKSGVSLGVSLLWTNTCFNRLDENGQPAQIREASSVRTFPETCNKNSGTPFPNPNLAGAFRISDKFAIGLAVLGPHAAGKAEWPDVVDGRDSQGNWAATPAPTRYMLMKQDGLVVHPALSAAYSVTPDLHLGAGFVWGIASFEFQNIAATLASGHENWGGDVKAELSAKDIFVPGMILGALWEASPNIDIGAWFRWSDAIRAEGDAHLSGPYYSTQPRTTGEAEDSSRYCQLDDGSRGPQNCTDTPKGEAKLKINQPIEAKLGVRYHHPREGLPEQAPGQRVRDPIAEDLFDIEVNLTYTRNSVVENLEIRFPAGIEIPWLANAHVPTNADIPHRFKDVFGIRVGGDYVVLPNQLAIRAGGFFETRGQDPAFANIDFVPAQRFGLTGGATVRLGPVDVNVAGGHVFGSKLDNEGQGDLPGLAGTPTAEYTSKTTGKTTTYRTPFAMNSGWVQQSVTVAQLSATYRF